MSRFLNPFVLVFSTMIAASFAYAFSRLATHFFQAILLSLPFLMAWLLPMLYWIGGKEKKGPIDHLIQMTGYLSMAFVNFLILSLVTVDFGSFVLEKIGFPTGGHHPTLVLGLTCLTFISGYLTASRGPFLKETTIPLGQLPPELDGLRILQISDLHVGPTIGKDYVERVVRMTLDTPSDLIVLTGDIVDGSVENLFELTSPLSRLGESGKAYLVLGNHDYYSGAKSWSVAFRKMGLKLLLNEHVIIEKGGKEILLAGVTDPVASAFSSEAPDPKRAMENGPGLKDEGPRLLLSHHPKLAQSAAKAGFDLQLSGHTHAGQFIPWTYVVKLIHKKFYWGVSEEGKMKVFVSAGTGTWGPPVRFGTSPELNLIHLKTKL